MTQAATNNTAATTTATTTTTETTKATEAAPAESLLTQTQQTQQTQTQTPTQTTQQQNPGGEKNEAEVKTDASLFDPAKVKLPEGYSMDENLMKEFSPFAAELKLNHENGQKIVDLYVKGLQSQVAKLETKFKEDADAQIDQWKKESVSDKEFGGAKFQENLAVAGKAIARFGSPALKILLDETGLGNHPEVIRAFYKAGKLISEDGLGDRTEAVVNQSKTAAQVMYPSHGQTATA